MKNWINNRYHGIVFGRTKIGEYLNSFYSLKLFLKYAFRNGYSKEKESVRSFVIKQYHIIEKGLAMPAPRNNFGIPKIKVLLNRLEIYEKRFGYDTEISDPVRKVLTEYLATNPDLGRQDSELHSQLIQLIKTSKNSYDEGGTKLLSSEELRQSINLDFESFVRSRTSVRDFKDEMLRIQDIERAVDIARNAPSVCNRQNWRLHYFDNESLKNKLLDLQHGNTGFRDSIKGLFIVTMDIKGFTIMEQNQVFVDGGLISMNLVLSLHSLGIGSCCLNTCFPYTREKKMKNVGGIPKNERLIMMIGVGYWKEEFKVAYSKKKEINEILRIH